MRIAGAATTDKKTEVMKFPENLKIGDRIEIVAPATTVKREYVEGCAKVLRDTGFDARIAPHALGPADGTYATSPEGRISDLREAMLNPEVRVIFCARGGFGCVHLLPHLPAEALREDPKWLVGFSDVSALHALWLSNGVASLHGPMAKHFKTFSGGDSYSRMTLQALMGLPEMNIESRKPHPYNRRGIAKGRLCGGNLAVLDGLVGTPYDILATSPFDDEGRLLFIEDIAEPIYKVDRILTQLHLAGTLKRIKGLIVGQFTEYRPDLNFSSMEEMIATWLEEWGYSELPIVFGFKVGHVDENWPLIEGAVTELRVTSEGWRLKQERL